MQRSESINELAAAMAKAQGAIQHAAKDAANPFFKSKYADLASCWDACRKPLSDNGLAIMQLPTCDGATATVETILTHSSGQWISESLTMMCKESTAQGIGSTITYARRYSLCAMAGIAPEDDDGNAGSGRGSVEAAQQVAQRKIQEMQKPARAPFDIMKAFGKIKLEIAEEDYRRILKDIGGVSKSNQFPNTPAGIELARTTYRAMLHHKKASEEAIMKANGIPEFQSWPDNFDGPILRVDGVLYKYNDVSGNYVEVAQ